MTNQIEIEFKTKLTKDEYAHCLHHLHITDHVTQTNYYFDDDHYHLKKHHAALRIRIINNEYEMTLKTKATTGHLEITETITDEEYQQFLETKTLPNKHSITEQLTTMDTDLSKVNILAQLTTKRFEKQLNDNCTIMLDESHYYNQTDYELEMEVIDVDKGKTQFLQLLNDLNLSYRPSEPKILRALQAKDRM